MKSGFLLILFVLFIAESMAQVVTKTVNLSAGSLSASLTADEKSKITKLTLTGNIDARDFKCMRDEITLLNDIDISAVSIVAYSGTEGTVGSNKTYPANQLPEYSFVNSVTSKGKTSLVNIALPVSLVEIGNYAFQECTGLLEILVPNSVTVIGEGAFKGCTNMLKATVSNSITKIDNTVFYRCYGLTSFTIPGTVTQIGSSAFYQCTNLASIVIPNSVKSIGDHAFEGCGWMTDIKIGKSVETIGTEAFRDCISLKNLKVNQMKCPVINQSTFSGVQKWLVNLEVPIGAKATYAGTAYWNEFSIVEKDLTTGIEQINSNKLKVFASSGEIIVDGSVKGEIIEVFSLNGSLIKKLKSSGNLINIPVHKSGIYLVKTNSKAIKVVI